MRKMKCPNCKREYTGADEGRFFEKGENGLINCLMCRKSAYEEFFIPAEKVVPASKMAKVEVSNEREEGKTDSTYSKNTSRKSTGRTVRSERT